jgi:hypothetical protein
MSASEDEDAIKAIAADGPHPALSERVRVRRSNRRPDHLDPLGAEDFVEGAAELRVTIVDQQLKLRLMLAQLHGEIARLLADPDAVRVGCAGDELEPAGRERDEEEDVDPPQRERLDREEITGERAGGLLAQERPPRLPSAFGSRRDVSDAQHLADRGRRDRKPEQLELAGDPLIAPMRVLAGET